MLHIFEDDVHDMRLFNGLNSFEAVTKTLGGSVDSSIDATGGPIEGANGETSASNPPSILPALTLSNTSSRRVVGGNVAATFSGDGGGGDDDGDGAGVAQALIRDLCS